jgi:hypothetical protein
LVFRYIIPIYLIFIEKYKDKVDWYYISKYQNLSEDFIEKYKDKLDWNCISRYQNLSEPFIEKYKDKLDWECISAYQNLSEPFIEKYRDKINIETYRKSHEKKTYKQKLEEVKSYAEKYNLKHNSKYLYAYRNHTPQGRGMIKPIIYKKGVYYKDWHCDVDKHNYDSYGFGIWNKGNTRVKVKIGDWGVEVRDKKGKARVWGFEII